MNRIYSLLALILVTAVCADAQGIRERIRLKNREGSAGISEAQGVDVTLTKSAVATRQIQQIVRTGGRIDNARKVLTVTVPSPDAENIQPGQRARAFPPESKSSMFQARVTRVTSQNGRALVEVALAGTGLQGANHYVVEITVERGEFLSVPNEAIIEEGDRRVVYVEEQTNRYMPREIQGGIQGELYTEIKRGVKEGDEVVTFGSFFIDSEYKLKLADQTLPGQ